MRENSGMRLDSGTDMTLRQQIGWVARLSVPAILAEVTSIAMQYIDAAMVGSLGENASAAIGLVSSSTWLLGGLCLSLATGFSVQVAHLTGAGRDEDARDVLRQALMAAAAFGLLLALIGAALSGPLPRDTGMGAAGRDSTVMDSTAISTPPGARGSSRTVPDSSTQHSSQSPSGRTSGAHTH